TDQAGNPSALAEDKAGVDNVAAPAPIVELQGAGDDNTYNKDEIGSDNSVTAKVTLTAGTQVGDLLVVTNGAGGELFRGEVTAEMLKDGLTVEVPVVGTPDEIKVTAQVTDQAGNPSALAEDKAGVDNVAAPAPTVVIVDDANNDQLLTKAEIGNDSIQVMVQVNAADLTAGGKVNLSITNGNTTSNVELKLVDGKLVDASGKEYGYSNGTISWTEPRPVDGGQLKVDATQTDKAGNTSDKGGDQATVIYASDDSFAEQEDQLVTGQLLTNDHSSNTSIVSFTVMYNGTLTSFNAGQTVALSIGSLLIQANGEFKFIPNQHWSGDVPTVTYTTNTGDTATLNITVQPVADKPLVDVILTANGTPLYSGFISSGITTEQFRNGDFTQQPFNTGAKQTDASSGQDTVYGSNGNDHMVSTNGGGDHLLGYAGNDVLVGGDAIQGDTIDGGIGNDILVAGLGQDSLYGGEGNDIAVLMGNRADYIITKDYRHSQWDNWFNFTTIEHGQTITKALHDIEYIQFDDGIYELDKNTGELVMVQPTYVDYPVEIHASLTDRDGSELLDSIELSGLPAGTQVFYNGQLLGVADNAGKLLLDYNGPNGWSGGNLWSENALDATLTGVTIRIPGASAGQVDLVIEAVAREKGTDLTNSATGEDAIRLDYFKGTEGEPGDQNVNFGSEHNIVVGDLDGSIVLPGQNYNIAFMVDSSGSIGEKALDAMEAQLKLVFNSLKASAMEEGSGTVKVFLVDFDGRAKSWVSVDLKDPNAISTLENALKEMTVGGNTNYEDVFKTTANWFSDIDGNSATNLAYFITDGQANQYNYNEGQNPVVYDPRGANNSIDLSTIIQNGYVFGNTYSQDGRMIINQYGEVLKWTQNNNNSWSSSSVGFMRPDGNGGFQFANLGTNGTGANANSQQGFAFLSTMGVIVQAIGIGPSLDRDDLKPFDSDGNVLTNINAGDLADAILGDQVNAIPGSDRFDGGAGDDIIFGDAIHFTGISGQGYAAIKAYVADKISINEVSDAQVHRYIGEHSDEFDRSGSNDKADTLFGGAGNDILFGQGGNDELYGNDGKDILYGGTGSDKLYGGLGNDILTGGEGKDFFVWNQGDASASKPAVDVITDFNKMANNTVDLNQKDVIDLSELLDSDGGKSEASLKGLLSIFEDSGKVRLEVRDDTPQHNLMQTIVLEGHSFASLTGNTYTDKSQTSQVIDYMLLNNMLEIDKPHG
ncbi:VWA domain-containing protein, partial [Aeromonas veronii]|uniref:VWA domain-containing protein n=1 Tax=Aeromonas veronii TaxID=654 RepID=UPI002B495177